MLAGQHTPAASLPPVEASKVNVFVPLPNPADILPVKVWVDVESRVNLPPDVALIVLNELLPVIFTPPVPEGNVNL